MTIHQLLKSHPGKITVCVDGIAASIASVIALAGDEISISTGGMFMVHSASLATRGNSRQLVKDAATLAKIDASLTDIYTAATKQPREKIRAMMEGETWLNATEAVSLGFAQKKFVGIKAAAEWKAAEHPGLPQAALAAAGLVTAPDSRRAISAEIDRLRSENAVLRAKIEAKAPEAATPTLSGLPLVEASFAHARDSKNPKPTADRTGKAPTPLDRVQAAFK
jgi:ATP-dependent Clp protease, protease subunit